MVKWTRPRTHEPLQITGKRGNAVLLSEADWIAIQETLHLVSIPRMRESILDGLATPVANLHEQPEACPQARCRVAGPQGQDRTVAGTARR
jgi:antitoxin YefM